MPEKEREHEFDAEKFKELLGVFGDKIPAILNSLTDSIYGKEASAKFGTAVSNFYKTLKDSGMTDEQAFKLTEQYMSSLNLGGMIAKAISSRGKGEECWPAAGVCPSSRRPSPSSPWSSAWASSASRCGGSAGCAGSDAP